MATSPQAQQARSYHAEQAALAAAGATAVAGSVIAAGVPWAVVLERWAQYQLRAATIAVQQMAAWLGRPEPTIDPRAFAGVSSAGFSIAEPLIATIDRRVPGPAAAIPAPWWTPADVKKFFGPMQQLIEAEIMDAARSAAQAELFDDEGSRGYIRVLVPPSCKRCAILAGRIYRDSEAFERHPGCDCVHYPAESWEEARDLGLVVSPQDAYDQGMIRDLTDAERRALDEGADIVQVVNSSSGVYAADLFGRRVYATRSGTTRRGLWRKANPNALVRLRPESIYEIVDRDYGGDREVARRLLRKYGYLDDGGDADAAVGDAATPVGRDRDRGFGEPPAGEKGDRAVDAYWRNRQTALEGQRFTARGAPMDPDEVLFAERMLDLGQSLEWLPQDKASLRIDPRTGNFLPTNDFEWNGDEWEHKALEPTTPVDAVHIARQVTKATKKGKLNVVVDVGDRPLPAGTVEELRRYNLNPDRPSAAAIWVMSRGRLFRVDLLEN